jgi:glycosyltransferase involved in cell wall biosynthesis
MKKLAIISTHPIQYNAPFFKILAQDIRFSTKVFYTLGKEASDFVDPGFRKSISWDIPLLEGYTYEFVRNVSSKPSTSSFKGIVNPTLVNSIQQYGATDILVYGWSFSSHLKVMRYFKNKARIYFRGDSTLLDEKSGLKSVLRRLWLSWVYKHIDVALYVGTNNKEYFLKYGVKDTALTFAPHAIDYARFNDYQYEGAVKKLKYELGITDEAKVFIFTGKFEWKKNPTLLVKAFNKLHVSNAFLVMVGSGALEEAVKKEAGDNPNIRFLTFQNQSIMPVIYRIGDVLVLPSDGPGETWGLCINEAMACSRSIIVSDKVGCAIDLVQPGKNGCIFKSGDQDELINILTLLCNKTKDELAQMGKSSNNIIKNWSYQVSASAVSNLILRNNS